jgi:formylglycine-generating enzyme required for sulfatase activity
VALLLLVGIFVWREQERQQRQAAQQQQPGKELSNSIGMTFVLIPAGEFMMGSDTGDNDEKPIHKVRLSKAFYLGKYEVTQGQWQAVMGNNPSNFKGNANLPVESVSWDDMQEFIRKLNAKEGGTKYRLPTEAEWEYAARAGTTTAYSFGNDERQLGEYAWYATHSGNTTHPVGQKKPNALGLYDMHGNVWEWVQDWHGPYTAGAAVDPAGPVSGSSRVSRGGGWPYDARYCWSVNRNNNAPGNRNDNLGLRLLSTWRCQRVRFTDRTRVPGPCPGGTSCAGLGRTNSVVPRRLVGLLGAKTAAGTLTAAPGRRRRGLHVRPLSLGIAYRRDRHAEAL